MEETGDSDGVEVYCPLQGILHFKTEILTNLGVKLPGARPSVVSRPKPKPSYLANQEPVSALVQPISNSFTLVIHSGVA